jgi:hypothetical protein
MPVAWKTNGNTNAPSLLHFSGPNRNGFVAFDEGSSPRPFRSIRSSSLRDGRSSSRSQNLTARHTD